MKAKRKASPRVRAVRLPTGHLRSVEMLFSDTQWQPIRSTIPRSLNDDDEPAFRAAVAKCCNDYVSAVRLLDEGARTAASVRKAGGKQPAPLESLAKHLRAAALDWAEVKGMHDDRLGPLSDLGDRIAAMADDADRRLLAVSNLKSAKPPPTRQDLIRALAKSCRDVGLIPTVNGRIYEDGAPTWFQEFVSEMNDNLLGAQGWGAPGRYPRNALFAEVAKAMRGDRK